MSIPHRFLVFFFTLVVLAGAWFAPLDLPATQQVDAGLKRALISFASARALNAAISVAQGTELSVQPAGVGATFAPGQLLDPVNDLVEQFSMLMLAASVAFGVQKVLITIGGYWPLSLVLTVAIVAWTWQQVRGRPASAWLSRMLVILLMLRFAVPVVTIGTDLVWQKFLASDYVSGQQAIDDASRDKAVRDSSALAEPANPGIVDKLKGWFSYNTDIKARFDDLRQAVERITAQLIRLMVVFVLQTLLMPVLLLWVLWAWVRSVIEPQTS